MKFYNPNTKIKSSDEDDEGFEANGQQLGYFFRENRSTEYTFHFSEYIKEPFYYQTFCNVLINATENDTIKLLINSHGGLMAGMLTCLDAIARTPATTVAVIQGHCDSAATFIALACDEIDVGPHANMLCHVTRGGTLGKTPDMVSQVQHLAAETESIVRLYYQDFLSEPEIEELLKGREIYLNRDQIVERLQARQDAEEAAIEGQIAQLEQAIAEYSKDTSQPFPELDLTFIEDQLLEEKPAKRSATKPAKRKK